MFQCLKVLAAYVPKYHWGTQLIIFFCNKVRENEAA